MEDADSKRRGAGEDRPSSRAFGGAMQDYLRAAPKAPAKKPLTSDWVMAQNPRNVGLFSRGQLAQEPLRQGLMGALGEHATGYKCALLIPDLAPGLLPGRAEAERARPLASDHG